MKTKEKKYPQKSESIGWKAIILLCMVTVLSLTVPWRVSGCVKEAIKPSTPEISQEPVESIPTQQTSEVSSSTEKKVSTDITDMTSLKEVAIAYGIDEDQLRILCQIAIDKAREDEELYTEIMYTVINSNNWQQDYEPVGDEIILEEFRTTIKTAVRVLLGEIRDPTNGAKFFFNYEELGYETIGEFLNNNPVGECYTVRKWVFIKYLPESLEEKI